MIYKTTLLSPVGDLTLASDGEHLTGLWLANQKHFGAGLPDNAQTADALPIFSTVKEWLTLYFKGENPAISTLSLRPNGGTFRQSVWDILCAIPYGATTTYGEIARQIAAKSDLTSMSAQAVGGAVGHNPISIIIPCHRVLGADGSLTGYAGGIETKRFLLTLEGVSHA